MRAYLAGCVRDGLAVGLRAGAWCAGFVGFSDRAALNETHEALVAERRPLAVASIERTLSDEERARLTKLEAEIDAIEDWFDGQDVHPLGLPCRWRAAVWELVADARAAGAWREAGESSPLPGDLAVFKRAGGDPRIPGQEGHVGRVETAPGDNGRYRTVAGNAGDRVARVERSLSDPDLLGWICYPRAAVPPSYHVETRDLAAGSAALGFDRTAREMGE